MYCFFSKYKKFSLQTYECIVRTSEKKLIILLKDFWKKVTLFGRLGNFACFQKKKKFILLEILTIIWRKIKSEFLSLFFFSTRIGPTNDQSIYVFINNHLQSYWHFSAQKWTILAFYRYEPSILAISYIIWNRNAYVTLHEKAWQ